LKSTLDLFFSISVYQPCLSQLVLISTLSISAFLRYYSPLYLDLNRSGEAFLSSDVFSYFDTIQPCLLVKSSNQQSNETPSFASPTIPSANIGSSASAVFGTSTEAIHVVGFPRLSLPHAQPKSRAWRI
jgi:hypothetical protein